MLVGLSHVSCRCDSHPSTVHSGTCMRGDIRLDIGRCAVQALDKGAKALGLSKDLQEGVLFMCASVRAAPCKGASSRPSLARRAMLFD